MQLLICTLGIVLIFAWSVAMDHETSLQAFEIFETETCTEKTFAAPAASEFTIEVWDYNDIMPMLGGSIHLEEYFCTDADDIQKMHHILEGEYKKIAEISEHMQVVYLRRLEMQDTYKNQGLGKQLFLYSLVRIKKRAPKSIYFWMAEPLDGKKNKERLFQFYKNCGATLFKEYTDSALFYMDMAKLDLGLLNPKRELKDFLTIRSRL